MILKADLAKAPYPTSWILNEKNIVSKTHAILWHPRQGKQLWFYQRLYYLKDRRVFNMDNRVCGEIIGNTIYGAHFEGKIEIQ